MADITGGTLTLEVDGIGEITCVGDFVTRGFKFTKEPRANANGKITIKRMPSVVGFSGTFAKLSNDNVTFRQLEQLGEGMTGNATITSETTTQTYTDVFVIGDPTFDPIEGTRTIEFGASDYSESARG